MAYNAIWVCFVLCTCACVCECMCLIHAVSALVNGACNCNKDCSSDNCPHGGGTCQLSHVGKGCYIDQDCATGSCSASATQTFTLPIAALSSPPGVCQICTSSFALFHVCLFLWCWLLLRLCLTLCVLQRALVPPARSLQTARLKTVCTANALCVSSLFCMFSFFRSFSATHLLVVCAARFGGACAATTDCVGGGVTTSCSALGLCQNGQFCFHYFIRHVCLFN